jgi:hypothetical protein
VNSVVLAVRNCISAGLLLSSQLFAGKYPLFLSLPLWIAVDIKDVGINFQIHILVNIKLLSTMPNILSVLKALSAVITEHIRPVSCSTCFWQMEAFLNVEAK